MKHSDLGELASRIVIFHEQLTAARTAHERTALSRQIAATDAAIDRLVYDLYGLTDKEIRSSRTRPDEAAR